MGKALSRPLLVLSLLVLATLGCAAGDIFIRATPTPPPPTRVVAPTFTPTPDFIQGVVVVTPPSAGTPGVIVIPPGVDPSSVIPIPDTPTPTPLPPTATPDATAAVAPEGEQVATITPGGPTATLVGGLIPPPTPTPPPPGPDAPTPTPVLLPTATFTPLPTDTPTVTPTPFVLVISGLVSLRAGPGPDYPLVAQLGPNIPVSIVGQNPEGTWFEICCVNGGSVWVAKAHVQAINDTTEVALVISGPPPTATPTGTPTETPTITPTPTPTPYSFQVAEGPLYFPTSNEQLTIWAKIFDGASGAPLPGYRVKVLFRNRTDGSSFEDRPNTRGDTPSTDFFEYNVPPGPGSGNRVQFNFKFEFLPPDPRADDPNSTLTRASVIDGYWQIYVVDPGGIQVSDAIEFNTLAGNINREVFVAWARR